MKITLLSGTNRLGGNTRKVVAHLDGVYRALGIEPEILDLAQLPQDMFSPAAYAEKPPSLAPFTDMFLRADGVHIVLPEYNGGFPGALKYFLDMLKYPDAFTGRAVALTGLSAGIWGALRPVEQLQNIFTSLGAEVFSQRVFMPGIIAQMEADGTVANPVSIRHLQSQVKNFIAFVEKNRR